MICTGVNTKYAEEIMEEMNEAESSSTKLGASILKTVRPVLLK